MIIERTNNHTGSDDSDLDALLEEIDEEITPSRVVEGHRSLVQNNVMTSQRFTLHHSIPDNRNEVMNPVDIEPSFSMGASIGLRQARNFAVTGRNSNTRRASLSSANSSDERNNRWEQREEENRLRWEALTMEREERKNERELAEIRIKSEKEIAEIRLKAEQEQRSEDRKAEKEIAERRLAAEREERAQERREAENRHQSLMVLLMSMAGNRHANEKSGE